MPVENTEIVIVGGGVIGLATAVGLVAAGREVVLIDRNQPGSGASFGNAGIIAEYASVPLGTPAVLRSLPKLIFCSDSPLALRKAEILGLAPWLIRFLFQSLPAAARANGTALWKLVGDAVPAWRTLAAEVEAGDLLRDTGSLHLYRDRADFNEAAWGRELRNRLGSRQQLLSASEVQALEPQLNFDSGTGLFFPDTMSVSDPGRLMCRLLDAALARGVVVKRADVTRIQTDQCAPRVSGPGIEIAARSVVIATGAYSRGLAAQAGDRIPLDTERGYHLEFPVATPLLSRPVCPVDLGFYMAPMEGRLRVAGTVELGGLTAPPNPRRFAPLDRGVRRYFPSLGESVSQWMGNRPSLPDSRPVIGRARSSPDVIYAFGHGHIGVTLAAITARLVTGAIVNGDELPVEFGPARFRGSARAG